MQLEVEVIYKYIIDKYIKQLHIFLHPAQGYKRQD
jgi:hypothetical protein